MMRGIIGKPVNFVIRLYTVAFKVGEGAEEEFVAFESAKFIEVAFCLIDKETGEEFYTEPITYSMN
jgi:hypothetical protein